MAKVLCYLLHFAFRHINFQIDQIRSATMFICHSMRFPQFTMAEESAWSNVANVLRQPLHDAPGRNLPHRGAGTLVNSTSLFRQILDKAKTFSKLSVCTSARLRSLFHYSSFKPQVNCDVTLVDEKNIDILTSKIVCKQQVSVQGT